MFTRLVQNDGVPHLQDGDVETPRSFVHQVARGADPHWILRLFVQEPSGVYIIPRQGLPLSDLQWHYVSRVDTLVIADELTPQDLSNTLNTCREPHTHFPEGTRVPLDQVPTELQCVVVRDAIPDGDELVVLQDVLGNGVRMVGRRATLMVRGGRAGLLGVGQAGC